MVSLAMTPEQAAMAEQTPLSNLAAGARDTLPMMVGAAPFGLIFGALVAAGPMDLWHGQLMSATVFAGSSQFIALGLVAGHAGLLVIWLTTFIVNLRHMLYAANLLPHVAHLPLRWRWLLAVLLTDETFAVMTGFYARHPRAPLGHCYFLGSAGGMYVNWNIWTVIGLLSGAAFPQVQSLGLDFAIVATFITIVVPLLANLPRLAAALAAGALAYVWRDLPYNLGLVAAVLVGIVAGMAFARVRARGGSAQEDTA
jgi:4-azaleucine resistance transporter AzlC